jgi:hypothetical protein
MPPLAIVAEPVWDDSLSRTLVEKSLVVENSTLSCSTEEIASPKVAGPVWDDEGDASSHTLADNSIVVEKSPPSCSAKEIDSLKRRVTRSVVFRSEESIRNIPKLCEISDEEIHCIWYNKSDYKRIKEENLTILHMMNEADAIKEEEGFCVRGLECRTKFGARRRKKNKADALDIVWDTQVKQWEQKVDDPAAIAAALRSVCLRSRQHAHELACCDEKYVNDHVRGKVSGKVVK